MRISKTITASNRGELIRAVQAAPIGAQIELVDSPSTTPQRRLMRVLLADISKQVRHCGQQWDSEAWKSAFLKALGYRCGFMPSLDGDGIVAIGYHSSKLSKQEMSDLISMMYAYGDENNVIWSEPKDKKDDPLQATASNNPPAGTLPTR
jgi:hypothetical protein